MAIASGAACNPGQTSSEHNEPKTQVATPVATTAKSLAAAAGGHVSAVDARGVPTFIWAVGEHAAEPADTAETAAAHHLSKFAAAQGLSRNDLDTAELRILKNLGEGGYLAKYKQSISGIDVYPVEAAVLMRRNFELVAVSGHLYPVDLAKDSGGQGISYQQAVARSLSEQLALPIRDGDIIDAHDDRGDYRRFTISDSTGVNLPEGVNVKRIYYSGTPKLEPAYFVEFYAGMATSNDSVAFRYIISARTGETLYKRDLTAYDSYLYRVWADTTGNGRPLEGPIQDFAPHPTGVPDGTMPALIPSNLVLMEGFNNNPSGQADPWLPNNARESSGNNVDAYSDDNQPDGYSNGDLRAVPTADGEFDRTFDFDVEATANDDQIMASVTELFYVNNWLHDWWYDSGFDEAAGNAQENNFERGGIGGDPINAQAQDNVAGGSRNNANMATPADGMSPRMQMYQWSGPTDARLTLTPGGQRNVGTAAFGPGNFNITGPMILGVDGTAPVNDGCTAPVNNVFGRIVLVDRGACNFTLKVENMQNSGAIGVIVANNAPGVNPPTLGGASAAVTIPVLSVTQADGQAIRALLAAGAVTGNMYRLVGIDRDGSMDHTVVAHEWGHYIHHRLQNCGTPQCGAMSEGWGDWNSIYMVLREGDDLDGAYATGAYATRSFGDNYFGIRRTAYSADFAKNALTFRHIQDGEPLPSSPLSPGGANSEVHNAGEIWSTMMWEAYTSLLRQADGSAGAPTFNQLQRRMGDYVVAGLLLSPLDATILETRDSILAAAAARNVTDLNILAQAFARRGAGSCAVGPDRESDDFVGVTEDNSVRPRVVLGTISFDESLRSCDDDGVLDAEERGRLLINVSNPSPVTLTDLVVTVTASEAAVLFPAGTTVNVAALGPFESQTIELTISLDDNLSGRSTLTLNVQTQSGLACESTLSSTVTARVNYDTTRTSTVDDVEADESFWERDGDLVEFVWNREQIQRFAHAWHGADLGTSTDVRLESPSLNVSTTEPFVISFDHRHSFEADTVLWDGGLIELSPDDGVTWNDINQYVDPTYTGVLGSTSGNPLGGRAAFSGENTSWPNRDHVELVVGNGLAGQTVRIRFRIGTDGAVGAYGWEIDNIGFGGIDNTPFNVLVDDTTICPQPLVADAGEDQTVDPLDVVFLSGEGSTSEFNLPLTFGWRQTSGPTVSINGADTSRPFFTAPETGAAASIAFELTVSDGTLTSTDSVTINVNESAPLVADAGDDQTVDARVRVVLDGTGSHTDAALPLTYAWTQTAGPMVSLSNSTGAVVTFEAPAAVAEATFTFELAVSDGTRTVSDSVNVVVRAVGPVAANAGNNQVVDVGDVVILDGSGSTSSGAPLTFTWTQSGGPDVSIENATGAVARITAIASTAGMTLELTLTVSDGVRSDTDTVTVMVNPAEVVDLTADAGSDQSVKAGAVVALDGSASRSTVNKPLTFAWAKTSGPAVTLSNPTGAATTFTAPSADVASVLVFELTVSDGTLSKTDTVTVNVAAREATPPTEEEDGGCGCNTSESKADGASALLALGALALIFSRRRR